MVPHIRFFQLLSIKAAMKIALAEEDMTSPRLRVWLEIAQRLGFTGLTRRQATSWADAEIQQYKKRSLQ